MKKQTKQNKTKILCLLSGGLDSILALLVLKQQEKTNNLDIEGIQFISPFFNSNLPEKYSKQFNFKLHKIDLANKKQYLKMLLHPKHGYGKAINPCIDCHIFMLKQAKAFAKKINAQIIATGEVLEERPFSQNSKALKIIEKETKLDGKLLRPLSAKVLKETDAEKKGIVDRNKLLGLMGRKRKIQTELAERYNLIDYQQPAGGCLLCEQRFGERARELMQNRGKDKIKIEDLELLKFGRHFEKNNIVIGRNEKENANIEILAKKFKKSILIIPQEPGPTALISNKNYLNLAKKLIQKYSKHKIKKYAII